MLTIPTSVGTLTANPQKYSFDDSKVPDIPVIFESPEKQEIIIETINLQEDLMITRRKLAFASPQPSSSSISKNLTTKEIVKESEEKEKKPQEETKENQVVSPASATSTPAELGFNTNIEGETILSPPLFSRIKEGVIMRCRLYRKKNILESGFPIFYLYNEINNTFLMSAKKRKLKTATYIISTSSEDLSKDSKHYVAKLKYVRLSCVRIYVQGECFQD